MPISPIVLQRRHAELGRIRLGAKRNGNGAPMKLESFRFTSTSQQYVTDLATLYGGTAQAWDNNGKPEFEVYTEAKSIPVIAVKGGLSQWLETWSGGGCVHRCDGERQVDGTVCDPDDRDHVSAKPTTRLSLMLPELEALGVFRLESHGWNAAAEIPAVAELAQHVGDLVPANLHLMERRAVRDGKTSRFVVPVLDLQIGTARLREIVAQASAGGGRELAAGAGGQAAIEAAPTTDRPAAAGGLSLPTYDDVDGAGVDGLRAMWRFLNEHDHLATNGLGDRIMARVKMLQDRGPAKDLAGAGVADGAAAEGGADEREQVDDTGPDPDVVWSKILETAGRFDPAWTTTEVQDDFEARFQISAATASGSELQAYLEEIKGAAVPVCG